MLARNCAGTGCFRCQLRFHFRPQNKGFRNLVSREVGLVAAIAIDLVTNRPFVSIELRASGVVGGDLIAEMAALRGSFR
jgi:hypothetical protein